MRHFRAIDLFCGAGGSSWGAASAGIEIVAGFDKWETAGAVYRDNFPNARFYQGDLKDVDFRKLKKELGHIDIILASPECTSHSPAKGAAPRCDISRDTAFHVVRFAEVFRPQWIVVENVVSMKKWNRFEEFTDTLRDLGYGITCQTLDSSDFGVPQSRKRLFILCSFGRQTAKICRHTSKPKSARSCIESNGKYRYSSLYCAGRTKATLERAERAIAKLPKDESFLVVYYGSDQAGGWQSLDRPLRTITTLDRFAYVKPSPNGYLIRMLQPEELKLAMGWPKRFRIGHGTRRDKVKMIGNAVCPKVQAAVMRHLVSQPVEAKKEV